MKTRLMLLLLPLALLAAGCASYKLGAANKPNFKTIFIENFKSDVDEPALETLVTTTVIQQFQNDGTLEITDAKKADVILQGRITGFTMSPVRYSRANEITPTEASMSITVKYMMTRRGEEKPFKTSQAIGSTSFFIGSDVQSDKRQGVPLASAHLGRQMVSDIVDRW